MAQGQARLRQKADAILKRATAAAQRLVEHYPVDDSAGTPPRRPRTSDELVEYVEWAAPRARKLGTRLTKAEERAIGFAHAGYRLRQEAAADALAAQRAEAERGSETPT